MAALTYLQMVQMLARRVGVAGTGPTTVVGQSGEAGRLVEWVNASWLDIQEQHEDWDWMRVETQFNTVAGQTIYTPTNCGVAATLNKWRRDSFRTYIPATGYPSEVFLNFTDYNKFRDVYLFGSLRTSQTRPVIVSIAPDKSVCLGPQPNDVYTVVGEYYTLPLDLVNDTDVPAGIPASFHRLIIYRAMMMYGAYESAAEVYQEGQTEFNRMMMRLEINRQPEMTVGDPLV
jgi:hypothetical protein